jgi:hypothetical protein
VGDNARTDDDVRRRARWQHPNATGRERSGSSES